MTLMVCVGCGGQNDPKWQSFLDEQKRDAKNCLVASGKLRQMGVMEERYEMVYCAGPGCEEVLLRVSEQKKPLDP